jgi:hypothetical protein
MMIDQDMDHNVFILWCAHSVSVCCGNSEQGQPYLYVQRMPNDAEHRYLMCRILRKIFRLKPKAQLYASLFEKEIAIYQESIKASTLYDPNCLAFDSLSVNQLVQNFISEGE